MRVIKSFLFALQFLTVVPVPDTSNYDDKDARASLYWYPWIGFIIGAAFLIPAMFVVENSLNVAAALTVVLWAIITGALHLDGLADFADGLVGGFRNREKTLAIMKDSRSGVMAIVAVVCVLLLKWASLTYIIEHQLWLALLFIPVISRAYAVILLATTPYARADGLGANLSEKISPPFMVTSLGVIAIVIVFLLGARGLTMLIIGATGFVLFRLWMKSIIGGITGDTIGAQIELLETILLITLLWI